MFETLYTTRALRRFKTDPIPDDVLFQLFDAAIRAPSGQNAQDWRFVVIRDAAVKAQMQDVVADTVATLHRALRGSAPQRKERAIDELPRAQRLSLRSVEHLVHHLAQCPVIIAVLGLKGRHGTPGGSAFPAVQNLLLAARALGLGGSVFNFPLSHESELRALLSIPDNNQIYCLLPIGYPTDRHGPVGRKPVADVVYLDTFGARWPFAQQQPAEGWQDRWLDE